MFAIIKQLEANRIEMPVPKRSFIQKLKGLFQARKNKRAYQVLVIAKRAEKAAVAKTNIELADEMEARSEALLIECVMCKRTDKVKSDRLFEEAVALAAESDALRFNI